MKINLLTEQVITPRRLAESLANASASEFAEFWFEFSQVCTSEKTLDEFAQAMAPDFGGRRKQILRVLAEMVSFHEMKIRREAGK